MKESKEYIYEKCDKSGNILESNLSEQQKDGLKKLTKRVHDGEIVAGKTDKSNKMTILKLKPIKVLWVNTLKRTETSAKKIIE